MLVFLAAVSGFVLTADLFNLFVWFELMSTAAFALCGLNTQKSAPLQGTFLFAETLTAAAVFRIGPHIYAGLGSAPLTDPAAAVDELPETREENRVVHAYQLLPPLFCLAVAVALFALPNFMPWLTGTAARFSNQVGYWHTLYTDATVYTPSQPLPAEGLWFSFCHSRRESAFACRAHTTRPGHYAPYGTQTFFTCVARRRNQRPSPCAGSNQSGNREAPSAAFHKAHVCFKFPTDAASTIAPAA